MMHPIPVSVTAHFARVEWLTSCLLLTPLTSPLETFNIWLEHNQGYTCAGGDCNDLVINITSVIDPEHIFVIGEVGPSLSRLGSVLGADGWNPLQLEKP